MHGANLGRWANQLWVLVYTAGLTEEQKTCRRGEIQSDVHEQIVFSRARGLSPGAIDRTIAWRMARGLIEDIAWRMEAGRDGEVIVRQGGNPPLPWLTMVFITALIVAGCAGTTQIEWMAENRVSFGALAAAGAGAIWLGLYLATHRFFGPLLVALGTICVAWSLWWTVVGPVLAVAAGIAGVRRAQRIEAILEDR